jgi:hypothetical protein
MGVLHDTDSPSWPNQTSLGRVARARWPGSRAVRDPGLRSSITEIVCSPSQREEAYLVLCLHALSLGLNQSLGVKIPAADMIWEAAPQRGVAGGPPFRFETMHHVSEWGCPTLVAVFCRQGGYKLRRHDLIDWDGNPERASFRFANKQMHLLGHDPAAGDGQPIPAAHPLEGLLEHVSGLGSSQQRRAPNH